MTSGQLQTRLPAFKLYEWQQIAVAVNQLAAGQQQWRYERQRLLNQLLDVQEHERKTLARELHDEYGQCLAASNAAITAIKQRAALHYPPLLEDVERIAEINRHLQANISQLLKQLRPADWDEQGLATSLQALIATWNRQIHGQTYYLLTISGDCERLSSALALTLFRIAQECLTNIAKHARASQASLSLTILAHSIELTISDNGCAETLPQPTGLGLLGMRERVAAFGGQLHLSIADPHGLTVNVILPLSDVQ